MSSQRKSEGKCVSRLSPTCVCVCVCVLCVCACVHDSVIREYVLGRVDARCLIETKRDLV
jgi:hypothetical protein